MTSRPTPPRARPTSGLTSSGSTTPCPRARAPGRRSLELRRQTRSPRFQRQPRVAQYGPGARSAVLRQRRTQAQGRRRRHAVCLCLYRPRQSSPGADAPVAHERRLVPPRVLGRERDRLGCRRHARATQDGRPARLEKVGAAGSARRQAQAQARHDHRRLGVHPVRRHHLLGQGRHRDTDPARRAGF